MESSDNSKKKQKQAKRIYLVYILALGVGIFLAKFALDRLTPKAKFTPREKEVSSPVEIPAQTQPPAPEVASLRGESLPLSSTEEANLAPQVSEEKKPLPVLSLSGIFYDEQQSYALINNQIVKKGDLVGGAKVVDITASNVDLEFEGEPIKLKLTK
jgi:hypothetical protein